MISGNSPVTAEFPAQRTVTRSFDVFFDLRLNKRLSKQSWGWWFETPSPSLWRHCNVYRQLLWPEAPAPCLTRWRHDTLSVLLAFCEGNPLVTGELPTQTCKRLQCFIGTPNKLFNKQSWCSCHRNVVNLCNKDHPLSAIGQQVTHKRPRNISLSLNWLSLMMTSSNRNIFRVIGLLCGEITGHRWIPLTKASNAELWGFLWSAINDWENNRDAGDLRRHRAHYDVIVMHD